ncbi:pancreatic triacylglycerol lipase-like [Melitaea cinxia]|uniref:pancreatic triacylglycerol lipase-like n=1 Tax=Melitaea cinxia TaxID=113334 RepID=UPI001E26E90E|nr:pancreatic triacylglycerol lipase-like [Melitaea cinxia]
MVSASSGGVEDQTIYTFANIDSLMNHPNFDTNKPTALYVHGYVELVSDNSVVLVVRSYLQRGDHNVLALDWSNLAFGNYLNVLLDVPLVGEETAKALLRLVDKGLNIKNLHVVGHSLGAPVAAVVARSLKQNGHTLPRVTGLDPASLGFYLPLSAAPLNSGDASFVDIIHTDGGKYGTPFSLGHVDFWPNGGQAIQPGCPRRYIPLSIESFCSHWRSWRFYAESLIGGKFVARKSTDYDAFLRGYGSETALMGISATPDLRGNFYLQTATREPFALGDRGALLR